MDYEFGFTIQEMAAAVLYLKGELTFIQITEEINKSGFYTFKGKTSEQSVGRALRYDYKDNNIFSKGFWDGPRSRGKYSLIDNKDVLAFQNILLAIELLKKREYERALTAIIEKAHSLEEKFLINHFNYKSHRKDNNEIEGTLEEIQKLCKKFATPA